VDECTNAGISAGIAGFHRELFLTGMGSLTPQGGGTLYQARAVHTTRKDCQKHAAMGFEQGLGQGARSAGRVRQSELRPSLVSGVRR